MQQALAAHGANAGYLSAFPETFFDRVEARTGVWAPYYTLHKILAGLLDVHAATGDAAALELAKGMARWVGTRAARLTDAQWQAMLETEFGGMEDALTELYAATHDPEHLRLARLFDHRAVFDPLARGEDRLDGLHANTQIPKAIGAARDCELTGDARYCAVAREFWNEVALHRSYAIGGHSEDEHFSPVRALSRHLGETTAETCNTYNMLKLTRHLFLLDGDPARLDFYERALFNHILASQAQRARAHDLLHAARPGRVADLLGPRAVVLVLRRHRHGEPGPLRRGDLRARGRRPRREPARRVDRRVAGEGPDAHSADALPRRAHDAPRAPPREAVAAGAAAAPPVLGALDRGPRERRGDGGRQPARLLRHRSSASGTTATPSRCACR